MSFPIENWSMCPQLFCNYSLQCNFNCKVSDYISQRANKKFSFSPYDLLTKTLKKCYNYSDSRSQKQLVPYISIHQNQFRLEIGWVVVVHTARSCPFPYHLRFKVIVIQFEPTGSKSDFQIRQSSPWKKK